MKKLILAFPLGLFLLLFACRKDSLNTQIDTTGNEPQVLVETGVFGLVRDLSGQPAEGATVYFDNQQTLTDQNGYFRLQGRGDSKQATVRVEKPGYFPSFAGFVPEKGVDARIEIVLQEKVLAGSLSSAGGGTISFGNGNKIEFAANAFTDAGGQAYSGPVSVYATYLDPSLSSTFRSIPGSFAGINTAGERRFLESYGMMHVQLESPSGQRLNISQPATLTMAVPADRTALAPPTIPLWHLDESTGLWQEEGEAVLQNGRYVGQVSHFTLWNCDDGLPVITLSGNVFVENYHPIVEVRITRLNGAGSGNTFTNTSGNFSGAVPAGESLLIEIVNQCGTVLYSATVGPFSANTNLGNIGLPWTSDWMAVNGTLTDCNNQPVTNGYVSAQIGGDPFPLVLNPANGQFNGMVANCNGGSATVSVYGVDLDAAMESDVQTFPASAQVDVGNLQACAGQLTEKAEFVINGNTMTFVPCKASVAQGPIFSAHEITFTADVAGGSVKYTITLIDWNNGAGNPIWAYTTNYEIFGNPDGYYEISGGDIEVLQLDTTPGGKVIVNIANVAFDLVPQNIPANGAIKIVATVE